MEPLSAELGPQGAPLPPGSGWRHQVRRARDLVGYAADEVALRALIEGGDPVVYETYEAPVPEAEGHLMHGITVIQPGKIGAEYYMTKGHYHAVRDTAEVYLGLQGEGFLVMQDGTGNFRAVPVRAGTVVYVPPGWAHRSVNTGTTPLVMLYAFPAHAGHDYAAVQESGFSHVVIERDGRPAVVPAPPRRQGRQGG